MADRSKPTYEEGIDVIRSGGTANLLQQLRQQAPKRIIAIYAVGDLHYAWIERAAKSPAQKKAEDDKLKEKAEAEMVAKKAAEDAELMKQLEAEAKAKAATEAQPPQAT